MTFTFVHLHASGRWDIAMRVLAADLEKWIEQVDPSVITLTEAGDSARGRALARDGWKRVQAKPSVGRDECALGFRSDTWKLVAWESEAVSERTYRRINGKQSPKFYALNVVLEHHTGTRVLFSVLHTPSSVEHPSGWARGERPVVYRSVIVGWRRKARAFARLWKVRARVYSADLNLNLHKSWVRAFFRKQFPKMAMTWDKAKVKRGTHGFRLIDASLVSKRVRVVGARILARGQSSDHNAYVERLEIL